MLYFLGIKEPAGRILGLLRDVPGVVLRDRRGQCVDLPDDPGIMRTEMARLSPALTPPTRQTQAEKELAAIIGFTSAIAALRRLLHSQEPTARRSG